MPWEKIKQGKEGWREADRHCVGLNRSVRACPLPALQIITSEYKQIERHPYKGDLESI